MSRRIESIIETTRNNLSLAALLFTMIVLVWYNFNNKFWRKYQHVVKHDVINYYGYLPAAFIHKDLTFGFVGEDPEQYHDKFYVNETSGGVQFQKMTMGLSFMYAPFFFAGHGTAYIVGSERNGFSTPYMFFLQFSAFIYLVLALFVLRRILLNHFSETITAFVLISIVLGTNLFYYTTREATMPHSYNFFLVTVFVWFTIKWHEKPMLASAVMLGLVFGLISLIRPSNALIALFFIFYNVKSWKELLQRPVVFLKHWHHVIAIIALTFIVFIPQLIYWKYTTGSWFWYSYGNERFFFNNPQIINGLISYRKGWLLYTPLMMLALTGIFTLKKNLKQFFVPVLLFTVLNIYVVYSWWCWWYGGSLGSRPMIDSYPLMAIALASFMAWTAAYERIKKSVFILISVLTLHSVFQTLQYTKHAIHYDSMTRNAYWSSFGKLFPDHFHFDHLEPPDYYAAMEGIQAIAQHSKTIIKGSLICDYETLSPDGKYFLSSDGRFLLGRTQLRSGDFSRSGDYAIRLTPDYRYGSDFQIRTQANEVYSIAVWRWPAESEGRLVFSASSEKDFYQTAGRLVQTDADGWGKIETEVRVPSGLYSLFKVYLYNPGEEIVYFDDLKISRIK